MVVQLFAVVGDLAVDAVFRVMHFLSPDAEPVDGDGEGGERGREGEELADAGQAVDLRRALRDLQGDKPQ